MSWNLHIKIFSISLPNLMRMEYFEVCPLKLIKLIYQKRLDKLKWKFSCFLFRISWLSSTKNHKILTINIGISKFNITVPVSLKRLGTPLSRQCHNSFSNPSVALPTSQLILQSFRCLTYVTVHSPTLLSLLLRHKLFT